MITHFNCQGSEIDAETPVEECLRNTLVLQKVFAYFPTHFLLTSCSLVSKNWNAEVRLLIREQRRCRPKKPGKNDWEVEPCRFLQEFTQLTERMTEEGRMVPWNGMKISFHDNNCVQNSSPVVQETFDPFFLKHLHISWRAGKMDCQAHKPLLTLLSHVSCELRSLKIQDVDASVLSQLPPNFPLLEEMSIKVVYSRAESLPQVKEMLGRLIKAAPKLKRIRTADEKDLECVPEEHHSLLSRVELDMRSDEEILFHKIADASPALTELLLWQKSPTEYIEISVHVAGMFRTKYSLMPFCKTCSRFVITASSWARFEAFTLFATYHFHH